MLELYDHFVILLFCALGPLLQRVLLPLKLGSIYLIFGLEVIGLGTQFLYPCLEGDRLFRGGLKPSR